MREKLLEWAKEYTQNKELTDEGGVSVALDKLEEAMEREHGITAKSVSRYSVTLVDSLPQATKDVLRPYMKVRCR